MTADRRFLWAMLAAAIGGIALMPLLFGAEDPQLALYRRQIRQMTPAQHEHLQRNYDRFSQLSPTEIEQLRQLDADLKADQIEGHGRLNHAFETYSDWLQTIAPYERDALEKELDPGKKIHLIRDLVNQHREDQLEFRTGQRFQQRFGPIPLLKAADLDRVADVFNSDEEFTRGVGDELEDYEGLQQTLKLFELQGRRDRHLSSSLNDQLMQRLLGAIDEDASRRMLEADADDQALTGNRAKLKMAVTLWKNMELAFDRELRRRAPPNNQLAILFSQLPQADQESLLELSPVEFRWSLIRQAVEADPSVRIAMPLVRRFLRPHAEGRLREPRKGRNPQT